VIRRVTGAGTRQVHDRSIIGPRQVHDWLSNRREPGADVRVRSPCCHTTPTAPRGPQRAETPGRLPHNGQQSKAPAPQGRCDRSPPHGQERDRHARSARPAMPDSSLASKAPHPRTDARDRAPRPRTRTRGQSAPAPPARPPSRSPGSPAQPSANPPSPAAPPPADHRADRPRVRGTARSTQRLMSSRNTRPARPVALLRWSVAVRGNADGAYRPS
jgi:hypothetical protein